MTPIQSTGRVSGLLAQLLILIWTTAGFALRKGGGLPPELLPDVAYFDMASATAPRTLSVDAASGRVAQTLDQVYPFDQRLEWNGDCRYDASDTTGGGGSIVLDGKSCYGRLKHGPLCVHNWAVFGTQKSATWRSSYSMVLVVWLDDAEHTTMATYSRPDEDDYAMRGNVLWGQPDVIRQAYSDYGGINTELEARSSYDLNVPVGRWTVEVITYDAQTDASRYYRGPQQRGGTVEEVAQYKSSPQPDGDYLVLGCDWIGNPEDELSSACSGYYMKGRLMAFMAYSYALTKDDVQALYEHYSARWPVKEPGLPPTSLAIQPSATAPKPYSLQLVGGETEGQGLLLIYAQGAWRVLCNDNETPRSMAEVACRQLGFTGGHMYYGERASAVGRPGLTTYRDCDVKLHTQLSDCPLTSWGTDVAQNCDPLWAISLRCDAPSTRSPPTSTTTRGHHPDGKLRTQPGAESTF